MAGNTINVRGNYIDVHDNKVVNLNIDKATVRVDDFNDNVDDNDNDNDNENDNENENAGADREVPTFQLQRLLREPWFAERRTDGRYDTAWTDAFVEALMASEHGEALARDWAVQGLRERKNQLRGYVVGLLKDGGVLKGSYRAIAAKVGIVAGAGNKNDPYRTFADYMGRGKRQPYAAWVKEYVEAETM